jgi:hypothetical protein
MRKALGVSCALAAAVCSSAAGARAQERGAAVVGVGWAEPPPRPRPPAAPIATDDAVDAVDERSSDDSFDRPYRAVMRLQLGPTGATTGRGFGLGLGLAADFGRGSVGARLAAAWVRGEPSGADPSPIGGGLSQYTGELTLDLHKRGPLHPVFGFGLGLARVAHGDSAGNIGVGTARVGLEYSLSLDDADVRVGGGVTGVLPGPAERDVEDVKGWALAGVSVAIGF